MPIGTDDLSEKTYRAIIIEAEKFNHDLTLQFGLLSYLCENETIYITQAKKLIEEMFEYDEYDVDGIFFGNPPQLKNFHDALHRILRNFETLNAI